MASVDSLEEYYEAKRLGYRTFRVTEGINSKLKSEFICPASIEAGHKLQCTKCLACSGTSYIGKADVVIQVHGNTKNKFKEGLII